MSDKNIELHGGCDTYGDSGFSHLIAANRTSFSVGLDCMKFIAFDFFFWSKIEKFFGRCWNLFQFNSIFFFEKKTKIQARI